MIKIKKIPIVVITGPTASGKTSLSIHLAKRFDTEIISADSMQIYKFMNIGTAKPTEEEKCGIKHHLMDFLSPFDSYSVAEYVHDANIIIEDMTKRNKLPIIVGGTGLWVDSLARDIEFTESENDFSYRDELTKTAQEKGGEYLLKMLSEVDPESAGALHPKNVRRIIRALEFYKVTQKPISVHNAETKQKESQFDPLYIMLDWDRQILYERIDKRVDIMIDDGLLQEAQKLIDMGVTSDLQSMQGIGYKEIIAYKNGEITFPEAVELIKRNSRRYAKRQLTWFRRNEDIHLLDPMDDVFLKAENLVEDFLSKYREK